MKIKLERRVLNNYRLVKTIPPELNDKIKEIEKKLIDKYRPEIDKVLKLAYEITNEEVSMLIYNFTHNIYQDSMIITKFSFSAYFKDGLHIYKILETRYITPLITQ